MSRVGQSRSAVSVRNVMQAGVLRSAVVTRFTATTAPSDPCPPACAGTGLPSSRAELSERAMSLCPVPPDTAQNDFAASVLVSATMTRLTTGDLSVRSFEAYIRDFTFVWLIPSSGWASALRSPSAQPTFLTACRFLCRTDSFHSVCSAELCLAHHSVVPFLKSFHVAGEPCPNSSTNSSTRYSSLMQCMSDTPSRINW